MPNMNVENDYNEFIFDAPDEVLLNLEEKYNWVCYLKYDYQIELLSKDYKDISTKKIDDSVVLMNKIASSTAWSFPKIKEE